MDRDCLSAVIIDEVRKFVTEPRYRKEFLEVKDNLFKKLITRKNLSLLCMSATFPKEIRKEFKMLYNVSFDYEILSAISCRDIALKCSFVDHTQVRMLYLCNNHNQINIHLCYVSMYTCVCVTFLCTYRHFCYWYFHI